jgi:ABC-type dipeptide/oligopeptide/nickel transport system permease subunit
MGEPKEISPQAQALIDQAADGPQIVQRSSWEHMWWRLRRDKSAMIALSFVVLIVIFALCAPLLEILTGHEFAQQFRDTGLSPQGLPAGPGGEFLLGTDHLGRDVFIRLAYGARISLMVGVIAALAAAFIGVLVGLLAGYFGGWVDAVLSRLTDFVMSIPFLLCALALVAVFGASFFLCLFVVIFFSWAVIGRVIRAQVRSLKEREFVEASRSLGASTGSIIVKDILPNLTESIIVYATQLIPSAIVFEASLSFLGMGIVPPTPSWGGMLADASANSIYMLAPWLVLAPGLMLLLTTLAFNILGDGLRDALDPKAGRRLLAGFRKRKKTAGKRDAIQPQAAQMGRVGHG